MKLNKKTFGVVDTRDTNINQNGGNCSNENLVLKMESFLDKFNSEIQDRLITKQGDYIAGTPQRHENSHQVTDHNKSDHNYNLISHEIDFRDETSTDDDNSFSVNHFWLVGRLLEI